MNSGVLGERHRTVRSCIDAVQALIQTKVRRYIVLDLAAWQRWLRASRPTAIEFYRIVRFIMDMVGPRLMFASDWSGFPDFAPYRDWVKAFVEIPPWVKEVGIEFTKEEVDGFLGGNALKLLHLDKR